MKFNIISKTLTESVIDFQHDDLDPLIFTEEGKIKPGIRKQILAGAKKIHEKAKLINASIVGSGITYNYTDTSDIDVNVELRDDISDEEYKDLVEYTRSELNEKNAEGTQHPINYFIVREPYMEWKTDAIYDLRRDRWIKRPSKLPFNVSEYMNQFKRTVADIDVARGELKRDIIDFNIVKSFKRSDMNKIKQYLENKVDEMAVDLESIVGQYRNIVDLRHLAFDRYADLTEIEKARYGTPNRLPENVVYKLLERFYYLDFLKHISQFLNDIDWELDLSDVNELVDILNNERI